MLLTPSLSLIMVAAIGVQTTTAVPAGLYSINIASDLVPRQIADPPAEDTVPAFLNIRIDQSCERDQQLVEQMIKDAAEILESWPTTDVQKNQAYLKYMDADGDLTRAKTITKRIKRLADITSSTNEISRKVTMKCDKQDTTRECKLGAIAYVQNDRGYRGDVSETGTDGGTVVLCSKSYGRQSLADAVENCKNEANNELGKFANQASNLVHELSHLNIMMTSPNTGTDDCVYGSVNSHYLAKDQPWVAMINADNYAWMTLDNYLEQKHVCGKELVSHSTVYYKTQNNFNDPSTRRCRLDGSGLRFGSMVKDHNVPTLEEIEKRKNRGIPDIDAGKDVKSEKALKELEGVTEEDKKGVDEVSEIDPPQGGAHEGEDVIDAPTDPEDGIEEFEDGDVRDIGKILRKGPQIVPTDTPSSSAMLILVTGFDGIWIPTSTSIVTMGSSVPSTRAPIPDL